jgi:pantothenate kinase
MDVCQNWSMNEVLELVGSQHATAGTIIIGIAGPPAAGKSTFAVDLCDAINERSAAAVAQICPMDGFHHTNQTLEKIGLRRFKGRIDTFDASGYIDFLRRLKGGERGFYWPIYSRELHDVVRDGFLIRREAGIFVTEGNYLLAASDPWRELANLIDLKIYLEVQPEVMRARLTERHLRGGRSDEEARSKMAETDLPNAEFISGGRERADVVLGERRHGDFEAWHRSPGS